MTKLYNPATGEAIFSDKGAPWMGVAHENAPEHDRKTSSAFYVDGAWSVVAYAPDPEEIQQSITTATQQRLDDFAQTRGYDGIMSACTYATSTNAKFSAEGRYCVEARDATWVALYQILDDVLAGIRPMPTSYADIEPELPALEWPV